MQILLENYAFLSFCQYYVNPVVFVCVCSGALQMLTANSAGFNASNL